ncbi:MAG: sigma-70 family RNA polymerase sigma factor [Ruminococcaceae bacterium]|nr:sigma-70 family RNA polymerase sigma factor [Oscillospiraceae bacterium]
MNDAKLLKLLHSNPNKGIEELMNQYAGLVYAVVKNTLADFVCMSSDIEDCISDTFSEFYLELSKYDPKESSIKTYLCRIAKNNAIDLCRKRERQRMDISVDDEELTVQLSDGFSVEENVLKFELSKEVFNAINALGEPDSSIIFRKYYYGEPSKEIAERLNMTVSNVDTRAFRALNKLRKTLGGKYGE